MSSLPPEPTFVEWLWSSLESDPATLAIFVLSTLVCGGMVLMVTKLGAREKTFEEAMEEQRRKREKEAGGRGAKGGLRAKVAEANKANKASGKKASSSSSSRGSANGGAIGGKVGRRTGRFRLHARFISLSVVVGS